MFTNFNKINKQLDDANLLARKERNVNARGGQKQEAFQNYEIVFKCVEYLTIIIPSVESNACVFHTTAFQKILLQHLQSIYCSGLLGCHAMQAIACFGAQQF